MAEDKEVVERTETEVEQPSLRDVIRGAVEKQYKDAEPAEDKPKAETKPESEIKEEPEDRPKGRDEKGRFTAKESQEEPPKEEPKRELEPKESKLELRPPRGWAPGPKAKFDKLDDDIKQAIAQREIDVDKGFAKLRDYNGLDPWIELAKRNGTTLVEAVKNYNHFENALASDLVSGIELICQRFNAHPLSVANALIAKAGGVPSQIGASGTQPNYQNAGVDLSPIQRELSQLRSYINTQQQQDIMRQIDEFQANPSHRYYDNVRERMAELIENGSSKTLEHAYKTAIWENDEIRQLLISDQSQAGQGLVKQARKAAAAVTAKAASKAVTGAPNSGSHEQANNRASTLSLRDEIRAAMERQRA